MEQLALGEFGTDCQFPQLKPASAYAYGCRCQRCAVAKRGTHHRSTPFCCDPGCGNLRLKNRRYCEEHEPERVAKRKLAEGICETCGRTFTWYETQLVQVREDLHEFRRRVCQGCQKPYRQTINRHRLTSEWALRLVKATNCDLCGERASINQRGRFNLHVDHDHSCCPGEGSCGLCVRGLLCHRCNHTIASLESLLEVGIDDALNYLGHRRTADLPHPGG